MSAGFSLVATSFLFVSLGHFGAGTRGRLEAARMLFHVAGALTLVLAYASHHSRRRHPLTVLLAAAAGAAGVGLVLWLIPPLGLPSSPGYVAATYAIVAACFLACAVLSGYGWHRRPTLGRALVPAGFHAWTFSAYTWIFITLEGTSGFLPVVYGWRFLAVALMLWAMLRRPRVPSTRSSDATP
jgi:peptidoglycan/LPS O-acetylase OafA/YrhL